MMRCQEFRKIWNGGPRETRERLGAEEHREACEDCRAYADEVTVLIALVQEAERPQPPDMVLQRYREALVERFGIEPWHRRLGETLRVWLAVLAAPRFRLARAAIIFLIGIVIGQVSIIYLRPGIDSPTARSPKRLTASTELALRSSYLREVEVLLMNIENSDFQNGDADINPKSLRSLISKTRYLQGVARRKSDERFLRLLAKIEFVILDLDNMMANGSYDDLEILRNGIRKGRLLLRLRGLIKPA